jgi:ASC-1-like (ASCH) protein
MYQQYLETKKMYLEMKGGGGGSHKISVQDPWFTFIKHGEKKAEGRLAKGFFTTLKEGDVVTWFKGDDNVVTTIDKIVAYSSFHDMLNGEGLSNVLPGINSLEDGVAVYRKFYKLEDEERLGVLAIRVSRR